MHRYHHLHVRDRTISLEIQNGAQSIMPHPFVPFLSHQPPCSSPGLLLLLRAYLTTHLHARWPGPSQQGYRAEPKNL